MKLRTIRKIPTICCNPGDIVKVRYSQVDHNGKVIKSQEVAAAAITTSMELDTAYIYELENGDLGMECGFIGGMGKQLKP